MPEWVEDIFYRYFTSELATRNGREVNVCPLVHLYDGEWRRLIVTTSIAHSRKAENLQKEPRAAVLFSDPEGSGIEGHPIVMAQGMAKVYDEDVDVLWQEHIRNPMVISRYTRSPKTEILEGYLQRLDSWPASMLLDWYMKRIVIEIDIQRVYAWRDWQNSTKPSVYELVER